MPGPGLFGSSGTIVGTVVGVLIPVVVNDGLIILGVQRFWLFVAVGAVLVAAVSSTSYAVASERNDPERLSFRIIRRTP